jgi:type IV secretion system protein TrbL
MVLTLVLGVGNNIFQQLKMPTGSTVTTYQAFCIALAAILLMVLSMVASRLATDMIIGGPSLGVGTAINTTAVAYNTSLNAATSRPAVIAVKSAANAVTKGATVASWAGGIAYRGLRRTFGGDSIASASSTATDAASRVPGPNSPGGTSGSSGGGGSLA